MNEDRIHYPELFNVTQETGYHTEEQHVAALLTISGETHLVQGAPNFLNSPTVPNRPMWPPVHVQSLAPAVIGIVHSAFPNTGYMEYKGLANDLMELINSHEKESHQRIAQQERWIKGLQNHVCKLYAYIKSFKHTLQDISARLDIHGLTTPGSATTPCPLLDPFGLQQAMSATAPPPFPRGSAS